MQYIDAFAVLHDALVYKLLPVVLQPYPSISLGKTGISLITSIRQNSLQSLDKHFSPSKLKQTLSWMLPIHRFRHYMLQSLAMEYNTPNKIFIRHKCRYGNRASCNLNRLAITVGKRQNSCCLGALCKARTGHNSEHSLESILNTDHHCNLFLKQTSLQFFTRYN